MTFSKLARSALGSVALRVITPLLNLSISIALVRLAGAREFGIYSYYLSLFAIIFTPVSTSFSILLVRNIARHHARREWSMLRGLLRRTLHWGLLVSAGLCGCGLAAGHFVDTIIPGSNTVFMAMLALVPITLFTAMRSATLRGLQHVIWGQYPEQIVVPGAMLLLAGLLFLFTIRVTALTLFCLQIVATLAALLLGSLLLRKGLPQEIEKAVPHYQDAPWLRGLLPLMFISCAQQFESEIVIMLLGQNQSIELSGVYRICTKGSDVIFFVLQSLNAATAPAFSRLHILGKFKELSIVATKVTRYALLAALPIALTLALFGEWILSCFYGQEFAIGTAALAALSIAKIFSVATGPTGCLLTVTGHEKDLLKSSLLSLLLTISLCLFLIPRYGLTGAALASGAALMFRNAINAWTVRRRFGFHQFTFFLKN